MSPEHWLNALLLRDMNLSLEFADGWVHGRVKKNTITQVPMSRYTPALATRATSVGFGGASADIWWEWKDANNNGYFVEEDVATILQTFLGIYPARLRHWYQWPDQTPGRLDKIIVNQTPDIDTIGYINGVPGVGSPIEDPTTMTEIFVPPETILEHAIFNPEAYSVDPYFNIKINRMRMKIFNPEKAVDVVEINKIIRGPGNKGGVRTKTWSPGIAPWQYSVKANMGVDPLPGHSPGSGEEI